MSNKIKFILHLTLITICIILVSSCKKATYLKVNQKAIQTTISGVSGDVVIETDGDVTIDHIPSWIKATIDEECTKLHYEVTLNSDRKLREDSIVLKSSDLTCVIPVRQSFKATYVKLNPEEVNLPRKGGTVEVTVDVDSESPLTVDNQAIAKIKDRKIIITMPENFSTRSIEKHLKISCDDESADLTIKQVTSVCKKCGGSGFLNIPCSICGGVGLRACCRYTGKECCPVCGGSGLSD